MWCPQMWGQGQYEVDLPRAPHLTNPQWAGPALWSLWQAPMSPGLASCLGVTGRAGDDILIWLMSGPPADLPRVVTASACLDTECRGGRGEPGACSRLEEAGHQGTGYQGPLGYGAIWPQVPAEFGASDCRTEPAGQGAAHLLLPGPNPRCALWELSKAPSRTWGSSRAMLPHPAGPPAALGRCPPGHQVGAGRMGRLLPRREYPG